uniref:Uncharacterized protein n=1 Tax=Arundo donax TaxID=35708 RepID=A0A0A9FV48_ARUDO
MLPHYFFAFLFVSCWLLFVIRLIEQLFETEPNIYFNRLRNCSRTMRMYAPFV